MRMATNLFKAITITIWISSRPLLGCPLARSTVVTAIKFTIVDQPAPIDSLLKDCIGKTNQILTLKVVSHFFKRHS